MSRNTTTVELNATTEINAWWSISYPMDSSKEIVQRSNTQWDKYRICARLFAQKSVFFSLHRKGLWGITYKIWLFLDNLSKNDWMVCRFVKEISLRLCVESGFGCVWFNIIVYPGVCPTVVGHISGCTGTHKWCFLRSSGLSASHTLCHVRPRLVSQQHWPTDHSSWSSGSSPSERRPNTEDSISIRKIPSQRKACWWSA